VEASLGAWLREQLPDADDAWVEGLDRVDFGHSAEMLILTAAWRSNGKEHRRDVVLRLSPPPPGLLEPYDLRRQFDILRALEPTAVRAPRALWIEETGDVLGRPFYVMERLAGEVYEREIPLHLKDLPEQIARMSRHAFDQIIAIHQVDLTATGLDSLGDGHDYLGHELDHWAEQMHRWQRGTLPALERLLSALRVSQPEPSPTVTLVHGDAKPGNFAFVDDDVSAVFDWEMAAVGDPLADLGWAEITWRITTFFADLPGSHFDDLLVRYERITGTAIHDRQWYCALAAFKMAVILLIGGMLFDQGFSDDLRYADMAMGVPWITNLGLASLGIDEPLDSGPVTAREERVALVRKAGA
jgi:aminoglycoside phosphotransferase (APT) family kinase protein